MYIEPDNYSHFKQETLSRKHILQTTRISMYGNVGSLPATVDIIIVEDIYRLY